MHLPMAEWPTEVVEPAAKVDDLDGLISRYKGKTEFLGESEGQEVVCPPVNLQHPFDIKPIEVNAALVSSMLSKHKPNKSGKDKSKSKLRIHADNTPPFLRNTRELEEQLKEKDPEVFKPLLDKFRDLDKVCRILSICLSWSAKRKCRQFSELNPEVKSILERQATLRTRIMLGSMRLHHLIRFSEGRIILENRRLLKSQFPVYSIVLDPESAYGSCLIKHYHDLNHGIATVSIAGKIKTADRSYHIPLVERHLKREDVDCPKCRIYRSSTAVVPTGPLPEFRWKRAPIFYSITIDIRVGCRST